MYKFDDSIPSSPVNDYMNVGIHENVELISYEYRVSSNGNKFIELVFTNSFGEKLTHTEWEPKDPVAEKVNDKILNQATRFRYLLTSLLPGENVSFEFANFEDFANKIIGILTAKYKGQKVRIKVVYNNKNYTTLPNYLKMTWIESMTIPKEESRITIIDKIDKMVKDTPTEVTTSENPFASDTPQPTDENPF